MPATGFATPAFLAMYRENLCIAALALVVALASCTDGTAPLGREQPVEAGLTYDAASDGAVLSWRAPADRFFKGRLDRYEIRYAYSVPFVWELARVGDAPPSPAQPGQIQTWTLAAPERGRDLYVVLRGFDAAGNLSATSRVAHVRVSGIELSLQFVDALTGAPAPGLDVTVTAARVHRATSDASGRVRVDDLAGGALDIRVRAPRGVRDWHGIDQTLVLDTDTELVYKMIEYRPEASGAFVTVLDMLLAAAMGIGPDGVLRKWHSLPVPVYVPAFTSALGVDYTGWTLDAIDRWEQRTGIDLFDLVPSPPAVGIEFRFLAPSQMSGLNGLTLHVLDGQGFPERNVVKVVDTIQNEAQLYRILLHELGHTIRLGHLPGGFIMFGGQPLPDDVTDDEALCVALHSALSNGVDVDIYDRSDPRAGR